MRFAIATLIMLVVGLSAAFAGCGDDDRVPEYDVTVTFSDRYTDASLTAVTEIIHSFDREADLRLQESWPPVLRGTVRTRRVDLCETLLGRLHGRDDVANLDCQPARREQGTKLLTQQPLAPAAAS